MKKLLIFQTAYTYSEMLEDSLEIYFTSKDLDGYFSKVLTVNPIAFNPATLNARNNESKKAKVFFHNENHIFIEGSHARFKRFQKFRRLNFLLAQVDLFFVVLKVVQKNKCDFVRAEDPRYCGLWGYLFAKILSKPLLIGVWGNPDTNRELLCGPMSPRIFGTVVREKAIEKFILRKSNMSLAQNDDNLGFILNLGIPREKTAIFKLGNGIHPIHFTEPEKRELKTFWAKEFEPFTGKVVISIGQLEKRKLYDDALRVIAYLKRDFEIKYLIIGEGSQKDILEKLTLELDIADNVVFLGKIPQPEIAALLSIADLVLSPLTGRALTEALLAAAPVVAYDIDCHPELIESGITGELVEYRNYHEMAAKSMHILGDPSYGDFLGAHARKFALNFMDPKRIITTQIGIYEGLQ